MLLAITFFGNNSTVTGVTSMSEIHTKKIRPITTIVMMIAAFLCLMTIPSTVAGSQKDATCYAVHVASFRTISGVYELIESLKKEGIQPFYVDAEIPGKGVWYRVFTSFYDRRDDAVAFADRMKEQGAIEDYRVIEIERGVLSGNKEDEMKPYEWIQATHDEKHEIKESEVSASSATQINPDAPHYHIKPVSEEKIRIIDVGKDDEAPEYESGQDESALNRYRAMLQRTDLTPDQKETAARHMADCYFQIGIKGERDAFFQAMEHYRSLINIYPGNADTTAIARLRLAQCYDHVTMYYEAIRELRNLMSKHPDSSIFGKALHLLGTIYYKQKKYGEAVKEFRNYIQRYTDAADIKTTYFTVGDCYSLMNENERADRWYRHALERWPDVENLSQNDLMRLGMHYFRSGHFQPAINTLFVYLNLYPDRKESGDVMLTIAKAYIGMGEVSLGLKLLSLVTERYPATDEAHDSAVTMADLGVTHPGIKLPRYILPGIALYDNPLDTYSKTAVTSSDPAVKEELMFQRGIALAKAERYEEAFDAFDDMLDQFKPGRKTKESRKELVSIGETLVDGWFGNHDYVAVADLYFRVRRKGLFQYGGFPMLFKIGTSLREIGLLGDARRIFEEMKKKKTTDHERGHILLSLAQIYFHGGQYDEAAEEAQLIINKRELSDESCLRKARELMGDICYRKEMYEKAARFYSEIITSGVPRRTMVQIYKKYADALRNGGSFPSALVNYERALNNESASIGDNSDFRVGSFIGVGECYFHEGSYEKSIDMFKKSLDHASAEGSNLWSLYWMGRGYVNLDNNAEADQVFASLKEKGQDEFWTALVDYCIDDKFWVELYRQYTKN